MTGSGSRPQACRFVPSSRGADRPAERLVLGVRLGAGEQRAEPARPRLDVVVEEAQQVAAGRVDRRVARDVEPARRAERDVAAPCARDERSVSRVVGVVLHHDDLGAVLGACGATEASATAR